LAVRLERRDDGRVSLPEDEPRRQRHQRLVHVHDVEAFLPQQPLRGPPRARIDAESGFRLADDDGETAAERHFAVRERRRRRTEDADVVSDLSERAGLRADDRIHAAGAGEVVRGADADLHENTETEINTEIAKIAEKTKTGLLRLTIADALCARDRG